MHVNEDECLERMLSRFNNRSGRSTSPIQRRKSRSDLDSQNELSRLRYTPEDNSEFSANITGVSNSLNQIELIKKENYVLSKTNDDLRYILKELQIRLNDLENENRRRSQMSKNGINAFKQYKDDYATEIIKAEEKERLEALVEEKHTMIEDLQVEVSSHKRLIEQLKTRFGMQSEGLDVDEIAEVYSLMKDRKDALETQIKVFQGYKNDTMISLQNLKDLLSRKETEITRLQDDLTSLKARNSTLEEIMGQIKSQNLRYESQTDSLREELGRVNELNAGLTEKMRQAQLKETSERSLSDNLQATLRNIEDQNRRMIQAFETKEALFKEETSKLEKQVEHLKYLAKQQTSQRDIRVYNADVGFNTSNNDEMNRNYRALHDKILTEKTKLEEEFNTVRTRLEAELKAQEVLSRNLLQEKGGWSERLAKLQAEYDRCIAEVTELRKSHRTPESSYPKVEEVELIRLRVELAQFRQTCGQTKAMLEYYQKDNERLKRDITDLKLRQDTKTTIGNTPIAIERDHIIREVRMATPCKIIETTSKYERTPSSSKFLQSDGSTFANSGRKEFQPCTSEKNNSVLREVEMLRAENERLRQQLRNITDSNNRNVQEIIRLSNQINEIRGHSIRVN